MPKAVETFGKECHDCGHSSKLWILTGRSIYRSSFSLDPDWSSINHGVLLCDECCSVHLSLGRHISQIKSFKKSYWPPSQLNVKIDMSDFVKTNLIFFSWYKNWARMVRILFGNTDYSIHKIKFREKNHRLKIHYRS